MPCELDLFFWQTVKDAEDNNSGNPDFQRNGLEHPRFRIQDRKITPAREIVRQKIARSGVGHDLRMALIKQGEGPSGRAGIDSLPQPVEDKYRLIEKIIHDRVVDA